MASAWPCARPSSRLTAVPSGSVTDQVEGHEFRSRSRKPDESRMVAALDHGADDYVTKPFVMDVLLARVRVALRHAAAVAAAVEEDTLVVGDLVVDVPAHLATAGGIPLELSPRQFRLLAALVR